MVLPGSEQSTVPLISAVAFLNCFAVR